MSNTSFPRYLHEPTWVDEDGHVTWGPAAEEPDKARRDALAKVLNRQYETEAERRELWAQVEYLSGDLLETRRSMLAFARESVL